MARLPEPSLSRAVLIGTGEYQDTTLEILPAVANNLTDLAGVLTSEQGAGLPGSHCVVLRDPPAQAAVGDHIVAAAGAAQDVLLVYYSGHGLMSWDGNNELFLALRDTKAKQLRTSALRYADLRQDILDSAATTKVLILDCCFAGRTLDHTMAGTADTLLSEVDIAGTYVLAATENRALAPPGWRNTLFTGELLRLLREGVATAPGVLLTLDVLFREVRAAMSRHNWPEPRSNNRDAAAHLALAYNAAHEVRKAITALRAEIDRLAAEEAQTDQAYAVALDKIADPGLPPFAPLAMILRERLAAAEQFAPQGKLPSSATLDDLSGAAGKALTSARDAREIAVGPIDRRDRLRGRLRGYQAMADRLRVAEDAEVSRRYTLARELLWTKPCDLSAATRAVNAYQRAVTDLREKLG
ncbi:MAG: caspase family protein [Kibdelosporangium sp.]